MITCAEQLDQVPYLQRCPVDREGRATSMGFLELSDVRFTNLSHVTLYILGEANSSNLQCRRMVRSGSFHSQYRY
jgi:hypothetical protein